MRKFHVDPAHDTWALGTCGGKSAKMSTKIPWSTAISNGGTGSYTGVPSASFMCKQSMKKPRQKTGSTSSSSEDSMENGHHEDKIPR